MRRDLARLGGVLPEREKTVTTRQLPVRAVIRVQCTGFDV